MNRKGFTIVELLAVVVIVSLISIIVVNNVKSSMSLSQEEAYRIMKNNLITASYSYIEECRQGIISCTGVDYNYSFSANELIKNGYFDNIISPFDNKDLSYCLILKVKKEDEATIIDLEDNCY